ncbi:MAG: hypothetical protein K0T00_1719, partial [Gaiellaceae bacterium]|nr:hypothetical protein [Gaiellaceae bacterium]
MLENALVAVFAFTVVVAALSVGLAAAGRVPPRPLALLAALFGATAAAAWVAVALRPERELALAAAGISIAAAA